MRHENEGSALVYKEQTQTHAHVRCNSKMESLKELSWKKVEEKVFEKRRKTWKEIRDEMGKTEEELEEAEEKKQEKKWKGIAVKVGWIPIVVDMYRIRTKERRWCHVHSDIVSNCR